MAHYVVKLDEALSQIVEQTALVDNAKILANFRRLMIEPPDKSLSLYQLFKHYCKYVADNVDTDGLEIDFDDGPTYEPVSAIAEVTEDDAPFTSSFKFASLYLYVDGKDGLNFKVRLSRWEHEKDDGYRIRYDMEPSIPGLSHMNDFEVLLCTLSRAGTMLTWDEPCMDEEVYPTAEPEPSFS